MGSEMCIRDRFKFWYRRYERGGHYVIEGKFTTYFEDMEQKIIKKALSKGIE